MNPNKVHARESGGYEQSRTGGYTSGCTEHRKSCTESIARTNLEASRGELQRWRMERQHGMSEQRPRAAVQRTSESMSASQSLTKRLEAELSILLESTVYNRQCR